MNAKLECDLLVLGAGMAGLSAAAWAAERGANVVVVEKASEIGGSAILSGGSLWTDTSPDKMRTYGCDDPELAQVVLDYYPVAMGVVTFTLDRDVDSLSESVRPRFSDRHCFLLDRLCPAGAKVGWADCTRDCDRVFVDRRRGQRNRSEDDTPKVVCLLRAVMRAMLLGLAMPVASRLV